MNNYEVWIVEYSAEQNCFHIDLLDKVISNNWRSLYLEKPISYVPIAYAGTIEEASALALAYRKQLEIGEVTCNV